MFLSREIVHWAIRQLRKDCHPFIGITFLASKKSSMPVGETQNMSLDAITRAHLDTHHRLDPRSEFYFQPFKSNRSIYWLAPNYSSSGLQAINTQTFKDAFIHPRNTRKWGFSDTYITKIRDRIREAPGHMAPSLAAMALWIGKDEAWESNTDIETIIWQFLDEFNILEEEIDDLFETSTSPPKRMDVLSAEALDLVGVAYDYALPPDAPSQTEGALTSIQLTDVGPASNFFLEFGERLTLIAGDNGLGKSFLLDVAWWALTGTWASHPAYPFASRRTARPKIEYRIRNAFGKELVGESRFDWKTHSWQGLDSRPSVAALSIFTRVDGSFAIADETRGHLQAGGPKSLSLFSGREVWEGKAGEIEGLIRDWVSWQQSSDTVAFGNLTSVLEHLSPEDTGPLVPSEPVRIPGDPRQIPTIRQSYGDVPVVFASAGIQRILLLAYLINLVVAGTSFGSAAGWSFTARQDGHRGR